MKPRGWTRLYPALPSLRGFRGWKRSGEGPSRPRHGGAQPRVCQAAEGHRLGVRWRDPSPVGVAWGPQLGPVRAGPEARQAVPAAAGSPGMQWLRGAQPGPRVRGSQLSVCP